MLHREFADQRLNKVNTRREFFRVSPEQVLDVLNEHKVSVLEFTTHAPAEDFRMSWPSGYTSHQNADPPRQPGKAEDPAAPEPAPTPAPFSI